MVPVGRIFPGDQRRAGTSERIEHHVFHLAAVSHGTLNHFDRLRGRMQIVLLGLLDLPDVALIAGVTPVIIGTIAPALQDGLVLALIVRATKSEYVLGPTNEG